MLGREVVTDWQGGPLMIVSLVEDFAPGVGPFWHPDGVQDCQPLAHGLALPVDSRQVEIEGSDGPLCWLTIGAASGRPAVVGIDAAPGRELTMLTLRRITGLSRVARAYAAANAVRVVRVTDPTLASWADVEVGDVVGERYHDAPLYSVAGMRFAPTKAVAGVQRDANRRPPRTGAGRRTLDDDHYREVATVYRNARAVRQSGRDAIARRWLVSDSTAARWISNARARGFLGAAPGPRQGGELSPPKPTKRRGRNPRPESED